MTPPRHTSVFQASGIYDSLNDVVNFTPPLVSAGVGPTAGLVATEPPRVATAAHTSELKQRPREERGLIMGLSALENSYMR